MIETPGALIAGGSWLYQPGAHPTIGPAPEPVRRDATGLAGGAPPVGARGSHVVNVWNRGFFSKRATCTCGWGETRRCLRSIAVVDALTHAMKEGHEPGWPLVLPIGGVSRVV